MTTANTVVHVRFTDTDQQSHVNHVSIVEWVAHARVEMLEPMVVHGFHGDLDYVLCHAAYNFIEEIKFPSTIEIQGYITGVGGKSITSRFLLHEGGRLVAEAECINVVTRHGKSVKLPVSLREMLEKEKIE